MARVIFAHAFLVMASTLRFDYCTSLVCMLAPQYLRENQGCTGQQIDFRVYGGDQFQENGLGKHPKRRAFSRSNAVLGRQIRRHFDHMSTSNPYSLSETQPLALIIFNYDIQSCFPSGPMRHLLAQYFTQYRHLPLYHFLTRSSD
jgi:hypothetical protein